MYYKLDISKIDHKPINIENCNLQSITRIFLLSLGSIFEQFVRDILLHYYNEYYDNGKLAKLLKVRSVGRKSTSVLTQFKTLFGIIRIPQIQVRVVSFNGEKRQMCITRILLGVHPRFQIPSFMKELLGWICSMSTFRVSHQIVSSLTNFKCSLMSMWHAVRWSAKQITLELSPYGTNEFEADGTGIPTINSGKRGSELKKVFQKKINGKLHLVGIAIGKYKERKSWHSALVKPLKTALIQFKKLVLASDGDTTIINTAKSISKMIKIQKDLWHVFHQLKYYLWKDNVPKKYRSNIIKLVYKITIILTMFTPEKRIKILNTVINRIGANNFKHTEVYLKSAMDGFYTYETEGNTNIYTSKTERSMRTTNQRINVGVWSDQGAIDVSKIRLAYYYNGINSSKWK